MNKTQREFYNEIITLATDNDRLDLVEFCKGRIAVLDRKSTNKKPTKAQVENESIMALLKDTLVTDKNMTVSEIMTSIDAYANGWSNQKVSSVLKMMVDNGMAVRDKDKKSSVYRLVAEDTAEVEDTTEVED